MAVILTVELTMPFVLQMLVCVLCPPLLFLVMKYKDIEHSEAMVTPSQTTDVQAKVGLSN